MAFEKFSYLGQGVAYPLTISKGTVLLIKGKDIIQSSIIMILMTPQGSRYFLPAYGSRINELRYEPNDEILARLLRIYTLDALRKWEKRVNFTGADIIVASNAALIKIAYNIPGESKPGSLVIPFYRGNTYNPAA